MYSKAKLAACKFARQLAKMTANNLLSNGVSPQEESFWDAIEKVITEEFGHDHIHIDELIGKADLVVEEVVERYHVSR